MNYAQTINCRQVIERIIVEGKLILDTPAGFGGGENTSFVDMPLALDPLEGCALLPGSSIAGALRTYLRNRELGFRKVENKDSTCSRLFGYQLRKGERPEKPEGGGEQSYLIINDALGSLPNWEFRDGVKIDSITRTVEDKKKFDYELIEAGTLFPLKFELLLPKDQKEDLLRGFVLALQGFELGEISIGIRKQRGLGRCHVEEWRVRRFNLAAPDALISWLQDDMVEEKCGANIASLLEYKSPEIENDQREILIIEAEFNLEGSILIRSVPENLAGPDAVHLLSTRGNQKVPILSGTSIAGALRSRALRIAKTLGSDQAAEEIIDDLFGPASITPDNEGSASKIIVAESVVSNSLSLVQSRVKLDRFTSGAFPTALFSEQPLFGQQGTRVVLILRVEQPVKSQIGLLFLLLKDLWTGDLPIGAGAGVGRGRLRGLQAKIQYHKKSQNPALFWTIQQANDHLQVTGDVEQLEQFVSTFWEEMTR